MPFARGRLPILHRPLRLPNIAPFTPLFFREIAALLVASRQLATFPPEISKWWHGCRFLILNTDL